MQVTGRTHVGPQTFFGGSSLKILDNRVISVDSNTLGLVRDPYLKQSIHFFFFLWACTRHCVVAFEWRRKIVKRRSAVSVTVIRYVVN